MGEAQDIYDELGIRIASRYGPPTDAITLLGHLVCEHPSAAMMVLGPYHVDGLDLLRVECGHCRKVAETWVRADSPTLPGEHVHRQVHAMPLPNNQVRLTLWEDPLGRTGGQIVAEGVAAWEKNQAPTP